MNWTTALTWLVVSTSILGLGHFYVYRRLVRDAGWPRDARIALGVLFVLLLLLQPATFLLFRSLPRSVLTIPAFVAFGWMGLLSTLFTLLLATDLVRGVVALGRRFARRRPKKPAGDTAPEDSVSRRQALGRLVAGGVTASGFGLTATGVAAAIHGFHIKRVDVHLNKLPPEFDGFKIVQLSDVHVGPTIGRSYVERMVAATNQEDADLVAITGDLVDGSVAELGAHTAPLGELRAKHGTYFVTGNHEYYSGADEWVAEVERLGIQVLRNRGVVLQEGGAQVDLVGVTDHSAGRYGDAPDFQAALARRDPSRELLLLAHQPAALKKAIQHDVGLQLSGHTHAGQFWPWNWVVHWVHPVVAGLARFGRTQVYVNSGTGYWGPPVRLGTESEITVLTLRSEQARSWVAQAART